MRLFVVLAVFHFSVPLTNTIVYPVPNVEDVSYWHNYNIKYLKNILKTSSEGRHTKSAKNVILFIGDGMSMATIAAGRIMKGQKKGNSGEETELCFEKFPYVGLSKTYNINSQVPDSAATATALFSGIKTAIRVVGLNIPNFQNCRETDRLKTIIDWGQAVDKRTGIVTNTRITHATPAAAYAYSPSRDYECDTRVPANLTEIGFKDIARQLVENRPGNKLNVIFGGGRDFLGANIEWKKEIVNFGGGAEISCNRSDGKNLVEDYLKQFDNETMVNYVTNTGELTGIDYDNVDHVLGLFANNHMTYESLRDTSSDGEPSLTEMTKAAIKILNNKKNRNGYVLIVEGGKIDQAHHQNHARLALEEFVEFENTIKMARDMTSRDDTLIIVTADHSHAMVFNGYQKRGNDILDFANKKNASFYETLIYASGPGHYYHKLNDTNSSLKLEFMSYESRRDPLYMHQSLIPLKDAVHAADDVPVYSDGPNSFLLQRVFEQSYIPYAISYSACFGPVASMNPSCISEKQFLNSANLFRSNNTLYLIFSLFSSFILTYKFNDFM